MTIKLEDLPNELILCIFNHLSIIDILCAFSDLNHRFSNLIQTIKHLHIDFSTQPLRKSQFIFILNQLHLLHITSIRISNRYYVDAIPLFITHISPAQLSYLESLLITDADRNTIVKVVHNYPKLKILSIESSLWRSMPRRFLPHFSNLTYCHLPTLDLLNGCHLNITSLALDSCSSDNLSQLNSTVPNLRSLTLVLTNNIKIPFEIDFPSDLTSLKFILKSVSFNEFSRLIMMIKYIKNLNVSFANTQFEVHCFDDYLLGQCWFSIHQYVDNLQFNIIVHQTVEAYLITDLISNFDWFPRKIICQSLNDTNGYHLFSLPFIDETYNVNINDFQEMLINKNDFDRVRHLNLSISNDMIQLFVLNLSSNFAFQNLQTLNIIAHSLNDLMISFINDVMVNSRLQILELRFTSTHINCHLFNKLIFCLPSSVHTLKLSTICTKYLSDLLDNNEDLILHVKRLICSVKNQEEFNVLILLLLERFQQNPLVYLKISLENSSTLSNLLSDWLRETSYMKKATINCSDIQCTIWT